MTEVEINGKEVWMMMRKSRPYIGKTLIYTDRMLRVAGELSGVGHISIVGRAVGGLGRIVLMSNKQRLAELSAQVAGYHDLNDLSPEDEDLLEEMMALQNGDTFGEVAEQLSDIKDILAALTEKVEDIQEQLTDMHYGEKYEQILAQYATLMRNKARGKLVEWAVGFQYNLARFEETLGGFAKDKVTSYLKKIYKMKCADSLAPLFETYKFILHTRSLYLEILVAYYENVPKNVMSDVPNYDPYENVLDEIETAEKAVLDINAAANEVLDGFFMAAFTSDPAWNLRLRHIPDYEDITTFWKKTTRERLEYGQYFGSDEFKAYTLEGTNFIRCQDKYNDEYIYNLGEDKKLIIQGSIFRGRWNNGHTGIGSRYFSRSGREEDRMYRLYRYSKSGAIEYLDSIWGKDDKGWRTLARYRFNAETLTWGKNLAK